MDALLKWFMQVIIGVGSVQVSLVAGPWETADHRIAAGMMSSALESALDKTLYLRLSTPLGG